MRKERKEYEQKYLSRYKEPKPGVKKSTSWTQHDVALGRLTLSTHFNAKRRAKQDEIREYEKQYLSRYKQPKSGVKKSSNLKHDADLGTLTLRQYVNAKRKAKQDEISKYEKQYLSRYKQPKSGVKKSTSWTQHDVALGRLTLSPHFNAKRRAKQDEIREYEQKYLSRYKEPKTKKNVGSDLYKPEIPKPKLDMKKERKEYEQKYLSRYKEPKTKKNVGSDLYKPEIPKPKLDMMKERKEYEQKYLSRYKQPKSGVKKSTSWTQHDVALGRLTLSQHFNAKRRAKQDEIKEYEKQYLSRYKQPKSGVKKPSNFKADTDIGTLTLGQYVNAKRRAKQDEIKEYEKQYLSRYKQPKSGVKKSSNLKHDTDLGTLTLRQYVNAKRKTKQDEIKEYEKQYLSRYKQPKTKKNVGSDLYKPEIPKPKRDMKKERKKYEQKYLSRYKQPKSGVKKSTSWTQHDVALGRLTLSPHFNAKRRAKQDEIREYEKQYLSRYKQPKSGVKKPSNFKADTDLGTLTLRQYVNAKRKTKQDEIREYEKFQVLVAKEAIPYLEGTEVDLNDKGELEAFNPSMSITEISGSVEEQIQHVLEEEVNPMVASHGGVVSLLEVKDQNAYLEFGGGCQGCGMIDVTLKQGVEVMIKAQIPEIEAIYDVTDHAGGANPYYHPSEK